MNAPDTIRERLQSLRETGMSSAAIATVLSSELGRPLTRNSVVGMAFRLGLPRLAKKPAAPRQPRKRKPRTAPIQAAFRFMANSAPKPAPLPLPEPLPPTAGILDLRIASCRFVSGDPCKPFEVVWCGRPVMSKGSSWCAACAARIYGRRA